MFNLDNDTRWILGQTPQTCRGIAARLRKIGYSVANTPEDEQAASIHWMLCVYEQHGGVWKEKGREVLRAADVELEPEDALYVEAVELAKREGKIGAAMIQRRLRVGYNRAARLLELMESRGIITGPDATGCRTLIGCQH